MKYIITLMALVISTATMAQNIPGDAVRETDNVKASVSTPGDLNSQRIRGAAAINAGCATQETYDTTLAAEDTVDALTEECQAELVVADPEPEIDEAKASVEPTEDYPAKTE